MKIAIVNQPTGNRGDEAAHKAFVRKLAKELPDSQIDVIFIKHNQERIDAFNVNLPNVGYINIKTSLPLWKLLPICYCTHTFVLSYLHPALFRFRRLIKQYDRVICAPGGMCMGGFKMWHHIWTLETAKRLRKPIYYWGRSIGPFTEDNYSSKVFKQNSTNLLSYFAYISLRDSISIKYAKELCVNAEEVVDSAFLECPNAVVPQNILQLIDGSDYIVFVPNELTWHPRYKNVLPEKIDEFFLSLMDIIASKWPERKILMLPQTYKSIVNDYSYFKRLESKLCNNRIIVIDENQNADIQQKIIAESKLVIGARYHSIVFAINNEVPFVSLSYEHKMKGLLEKLKMTENMVEIQDIFDVGNDFKYNMAIAKVKDLLSVNYDKIDKHTAIDIVNKGFKQMVKVINNECQH